MDKTISEIFEIISKTLTKLNETNAQFIIVLQEQQARIQAIEKTIEDMQRGKNKKEGT